MGPDWLLERGQRRYIAAPNGGPGQWLGPAAAGAAAGVPPTRSGRGCRGRDRVHGRNPGRSLRRAVARPANGDRTVATHARDLRGRGGRILQSVSSPYDGSACIPVTRRERQPYRRIAPNDRCSSSLDHAAIHRRVRPRLGCVDRPVGGSVLTRVQRAGQPSRGHCERRVQHGPFSCSRSPSLEQRYRSRSGRS